jgi:hypothetical protein
VRWHKPAQEYGLQTQTIFWFIRLARMTAAELALVSPADQTPGESTDVTHSKPSTLRRNHHRTGKERLQWLFTYRCISSRA